MSMPDWKALFAEIDACKWEWKPLVLPPDIMKHDPTAQGFEGNSINTGGPEGSWMATLVAFTVDGVRGVDGTAMKEGTIMRLTRDRAEALFKLAKAASE